MQRPIEKYGWEFIEKETITYSSKEYIRYKFREHTTDILIYTNGKIETYTNIFGDTGERILFTFEELQAIYETAKQIIKEYGKTEKDSRV